MKVRLAKLLILFDFERQVEYLWFIDLARTSGEPGWFYASRQIIQSSIHKFI